MEAREGDTSYFIVTVDLGKLHLVKEKLKAMNKDLHSLMIGWQLTRKELEGVEGKLEEENTLIVSLRKKANARKSDEENQREGRENSSSVGGARFVRQDSILTLHGLYTIMYKDCAKLETSELCFDLESLSQSCKNRSGTVGESENRIVFVRAEAKMVTQCFFMLVSEIRPYTPLTEHKK